MLFMRIAAVVPVFFLSCLLAPCSAQVSSSAPYEIYAGYMWQSNTFNGLPGATKGMNGWQAGLEFPAWHGLRPRVEYSHFSAENLGANDKAFAIAGGGMYEHFVGREKLFADAMFGDIGMNRYWGPNGLPGETASFTTMLGGGLDTPIGRHLAIRIEGDWRNENLALIQSTQWTAPYRVPGMPANMAVLSTSLVWKPVLGVRRGSADGISWQRKPVEQELIFSSLNSFGHFHLFANSWWSYLNVAGVEYARHSWGYAAGARLDYVAELLPVAIFRQPTLTDVWGNNLGYGARTTIAGLGVSPVGLRMMWFEGRAVRPYYEVNGGIIGFTHKAISQYSAYENFMLQQAVGAQVHLNDRWDMRASIGLFHFSDAFVVPSNPGIDAVNWNAGLSYHLRRGRVEAE